MALKLLPFAFRAALNFETKNGLWYSDNEITCMPNLRLICGVVFALLSNILFIIIVDLVTRLL